MGTSVVISESEGFRIGVNPVTNKIYVVTKYSPSEGSVSIINGATDTEITNLVIGTSGMIYPIGAGAVTSTNRIYVASASDS